MNRVSLLLYLLLVLTPLSAWNVIAKPITITTSKHTPLSGAVVRITMLDGTSYIATLDVEGKVVVREVPLGILMLQLLEWKGVPMNITYTVTPKNSTIICDKIGELLIYVKGVRGQGIEGAIILLMWNGKVIEKGYSMADGSYSTELPEGSYEVRVTYDGKEAAVKVEVEGGKVIRKEVVLDVFLITFGLALGLYEFVGMIVIAIIIIVILYLLLYEYTQWRRRRLVAGVLKAK